VRFSFLNSGPLNGGPLFFYVPDVLGRAADDYRFKEALLFPFAITA
jgi:hypothetical protein